MTKNYMKKSLMEQGKQLFSQYGLQKTSIHDITKSVGIATGTFYNYYHSKEELYFDILKKEEEEIKSQFLLVDISKEQEPKQAIKRLLLNTFDIIETNPLIKQLYFGNSFEMIMRKLPEEKIKKHIEKDSEALVPVIEKWQNEGIIVKKILKLSPGYSDPYSCSLSIKKKSVKLSMRKRLNCILISL